MNGTLTDLASLPGMPSESTLRDLIKADAAFEGIIRRGAGKGDPWEIDLAVAAAYVLAVAERKADREREREQQRRQMAMDLGLTSGPAMPDITSAERKAMLEEELLAIKLGRERGLLVDKAEMEAAVARLFVELDQQRASFSARLALRCDLPRAVQMEIDRMAEGDARKLAKWIREFAASEMGEGDAKSGD